MKVGGGKDKNRRTPEEETRVAVLSVNATATSRCKSLLKICKQSLHK